MSGAMVPRGAGDARMDKRQEEIGRKRDLEERVGRIKSRIKDFKGAWRQIAEDLWEIYRRHLYLNTHDNFKAWLADQPFTAQLSLATANRMIKEMRPPKKKVGSTETTSNSEGSKNGDVEALVDMNGNTVPKNLREALGDKWLQETYDLLAKVWDMLRQADLLKGMKDRERFYPFIKAQDFRDGVGQVINNLEALFIHLRDNRPAAVCPSCKGKRCPDCMQSGLVPREIYRLLAEKGSVPA